MKRLILILTLIISVIVANAQMYSDTVYLANGKFYLCSVINANQKYIQYQTVAFKSRIDKIQKNANPKREMSDIIYMTNGSTITCFIIEETPTKVYYAKNYPSNNVTSIHMNNGRIIYNSEFGNVDFFDNIARDYVGPKTQKPVSQPTPKPQEYYAIQQGQQYDNYQQYDNNQQYGNYQQYDNNQQYDNYQYTDQEPKAVSEQEPQTVDQWSAAQPQEPQTDHIMLLTGEELECVITEMTENEVYYINNDQPTITSVLPISDIHLIRYYNGITEDFSNY